jgi:type II secretory pathway component PulF
VHAGETAGMLDGILDRLADVQEKILAIRARSSRRCSTRFP